MGEERKILVVDDNEGVRSILQRLLSRESYQIEMAENGEIALQKIYESPPHLILLDVMMPEMDGIEVCRQIRANPKFDHIYIIMLTAKGNDEDEADTLDSGADDFVAKPFNSFSLMARIRKGLQVSKVKMNASFDPLTHLYNRRVFDLFLQKESAKCQRYCRPFSLILIHVDHFAAIKEQFGHPTGERTMKELANMLQVQLRQADLLAQWGEGEMAALVPETDEDGAKMLAERLRKLIETCRFDKIGHITASLGVATMVVTGYNLVNAAEYALSLAKQNGRNRVEFAA